MSPSYRIVFYVSGHGFGHTSRSIEVIHALLRARPEAQIVVKTSAPRRLFERTLAWPMRARRAAVRRGNGADRQPQCRHRGKHPPGRRVPEAPAALVASEAAYLRRTEASATVGDIPPLAFAAAHAAGIPSIAIGNFTWDWIYEGYGTGDALKLARRDPAALPGRDGRAATSDVRRLRQAWRT